MTQPKNYFKDFMEHNTDLGDDKYLKLFSIYLVNSNDTENSSEENLYLKNILCTMTYILCVIREIIAKRENGEYSTPDLFFFSSLVEKFCNALNMYETEGKKFTLNDFDNIAKFLLGKGDAKSIQSQLENRYTDILTGNPLTLAERFDESIRELDKMHHNFENNIDLEADFQNNLPLRQSSLKVIEIFKIFLVSTKEEYCKRNLGR